MRIGIPNRSSLLHAGAVSQCVVGKLLQWSEYHPAKLFYRLVDGELWLCRCDDLCKGFLAGDLDAIFTGDDYAEEYLRSIEFESASFAFVNIYFALLCAEPGQSQHLDQVFTKYPQTAKEHLTQWGVSYNSINTVSGGSECFACCVPSSAAHDVICTGATQQANKLYVVHQGATLGCSWYFRHGKFPKSLSGVIDNGDLLAKLRNHYQTVLHSRDKVVKDAVGMILGVTNQNENHDERR